MSVHSRRSLELLIGEYEKKHGRIHPKVLEMPDDVVERLLQQAKSDGIALDEGTISTMLEDIDARIEAAHLAMALLPRRSA